MCYPQTFLPGLCGFQRNGSSDVPEAPKKERRNRFRKLARESSAPFLILDFKTSWAGLRDRSREGKDESDAGIIVREEQMKEYQPLAAEEKELALVLDTEKESAEEAARRVEKRLAPG